MTESNAPTPSTIAPGLLGMAQQNPDVMALLQARPELVDSFNEDPQEATDRSWSFSRSVPTRKP